MSTTSPVEPATGFRHSALFYRGVDDLVDSVLPFIREAVEAGAPVLVALPPDRLAPIEEALGPDAGAVLFANMYEIGANPARIIPEWLTFVDLAPEGSFPRGVGEPVWAGRRDAELEECRLHESLLNVAFDGGRSWDLLCPYDVEALASAQVEDAMRTHPVLGGLDERDVAYAGHGLADTAFSAPLTRRPDRAQELSFDASDLGHLRRIVHRLVIEAGVATDAGEDLVLAAHELATNSIQHGGGWGRLATWREADALVVEIRDTGRITDPMVGRYLTSGLSENGRGVWMANQLCDLVQVRSTPDETSIRLFTWL